MNKKLLVAGISLGLLLVGCQSVISEEGKNTEVNEQAFEEFTYIKYDLDLSDKLILGDEKAENSIVLAYDYSCPWCKKWMEEVLPELENKFINDGIAKYVSQPLVLLNEKSLFMANVDYNLEKNASEKYYDIQRQFASDSGKLNWGTEKYVKGVLDDFDITDDQKVFLKEDNPDDITITRNYTKNLGVEYVPTVYVNGIKIRDSFNLEEIEKVINGDIKENDVVKIEVSK